MAKYLKIFPTQGKYNEYIAAGYPKPNISYILDEMKTIFTDYELDPPSPVITGVLMEDLDTLTTWNINKAVKSVVIPPCITMLPDSSFYQYGFLESVELPDGLVYIGDSCFSACLALKSIDIPAAVEQIGVTAFSGCTFLEHVNGLGDCKITTLPSRCFQNCVNLTEAELPSTVTAMNAGCFNNCSQLQSLTIKATTPPTLGTNALNNTHADLKIYVPADSVEAYKAASGWSAYATKIQAIP